MVSVDYSLNETTRHADQILPPTAGLERSHYDLIFNMLAVRNTVKYSPRDAASIGLQAGGCGEVSTPTGKIVLPVEITDDIMPGVVSVPHGWGHDRAGIGQSVAAEQPGASINDVISDEQIDPLAGTSVINGQTVGVAV